MNACIHSICWLICFKMIPIIQDSSLVQNWWSFVCWHIPAKSAGPISARSVLNDKQKDLKSNSADAQKLRTAQYSKRASEKELPDRFQFDYMTSMIHRFHTSCRNWSILCDCCAGNVKHWSEQEQYENQQRHKYRMRKKQFLWKQTWWRNK